jgi:hypothetical protein
MTIVSKILSRRSYYRKLLPVKPPGLMRTAPSAQNALDSVPDLWASRFPASLGELRAGDAPLFEDDRMIWAFERLGGLQGLTVLELGPLEGGHSYMAQTAGATSITAVEMNSKAFLKCLITKELLTLDRCSFICGDATVFMEETDRHFDLCIACGILYHMVEPIRLLELASRCADRIVIWTHFYDEDAIARNPGLPKRFGPALTMSHDGFSYTAHKHTYGLDTRIAGFCGGTESYSHWLPRTDILRALEHFGWTDIETSFEDLIGAHGPSFAVVARKA